MQSKAKTVPQYLAELDPDRRKAIETVRAVILENLGRGFEEGIHTGMIAYVVPHSVYPPGYHCDPSQPLPFAALASQKQYMSLYLMSVYNDQAELTRLREGFRRAGKKLDMGKCCIRFKKLEDLPLGVIGEAFRRVTCAGYIERYEAGLAAGGSHHKRARTGKAKPTSKAKAKPKASRPAAGKTTKKTPARRKAGDTRA